MIDHFVARDHRRLSFPSARFEDWTGRIGLTQDIARGPRLEAEAGLDRHRWFIVAINVELACQPDTADRISVDAVDMSACAIDSGSGGYQDLVALANAHGSLPVTRIELPAATARDVLAHMTNAHICVQMTGLHAELDVIAHCRHEPNHGTLNHSC
ncbi:hypothetical protein [Mycobacterium kyogaense]|uniref:hypothetical protein n=1 Tax=Mycobacterium kyogaense TaxID=2212479 RepID=UPI001968EC31|nr:hypothetical protein [Mycobacterium kyogaense]